MRASLAIFRHVRRQRPQTVGLWLLSAGLGLLFVVVGAVQLLDPGAAEWVARSGLPPWMAVAVGAAEVTGGVLLILPATGAAAAVLLGTVLAGAITANVTGGGDGSVAPPLVLLGAVAMVGYARRPGAGTLARLTRATDLIAEREMAQQRERLAAARRASRRKQVVS